MPPIRAIFAREKGNSPVWPRFLVRLRSAGKRGILQTKIKTVQQHILDEERLHPGATGDFTALLTSLTLAAKIISREVNKAGLVKILGETGEINVHGESVQKLDEFAQQTICRAMGHNGHLCVMASEGY